MPYTAKRIVNTSNGWQVTETDAEGTVVSGPHNVFCRADAASAEDAVAIITQMADAGATESGTGGGV